MISEIHPRLQEGRGEVGWMDGGGELNEWEENQKIFWTSSFTKQAQLVLMLCIYLHIFTCSIDKIISNCYLCIHSSIYKPIVESKLHWLSFWDSILKLFWKNENWTRHFLYFYLKTLLLRNCVLPQTQIF